MATVWRACDTVTGHDVAVKRMHPRAQDDPDLLARFRREAQVVARLSHPCLVRLIDEGSDDDGPYIVFELVEGTSLKALIRARGRLTPQEAASITSQVARALEVAHRAGVVHRDIKSHNILVTDEGTAKLTDFGIARLLDADSGGLTRTGTVLGTSDYLAPEQARGLGIDGRTDVYALGVVLYECLTGELPFPADAPMAVALRQVRDPMPDPRVRVPGTPAHLASVVLRACEKDPGARFASALDMADAVMDSPSEGTAVMPVLPAPLGGREGEIGRLGAVGDWGPDRPAPPADDDSGCIGAPTTAAADIGEQTGPVPVVAQDPAPQLFEPVVVMPTLNRHAGPWVLLSLLVIAAVGVGVFVVVRGADGGSSTGGAAGTGSAQAMGDAVGQLVTLPLASVTATDPQGEGREMPAEVPLSYDGNDSSSWHTERYVSADFGNIKSGVGLTLTLASPAVAREMDLTSPSTGGAFEVRVGALTDTPRVVGRGSFREGRHAVPLRAGPAATDYTLWITDLPPAVTGGGYQAGVAEVSVKGTSKVAP